MLFQTFSKKRSQQTRKINLCLYPINGLIHKTSTLMWLLSIYFSAFKWAHALCTHPFIHELQNPPPDSRRSHFAFSVRTNSNPADVHSESCSKWDEVGKLKWLNNSRLNVMKSEISVKVIQFASFCRTSKRDHVMRAFSLRTEIMQTMNTRPLSFVAELVDNGLRIKKTSSHLDYAQQSTARIAHKYEYEMEFFNEIL